MQQVRTEQGKQRLLEALQQTHGIISHACAAADIDPTTYREWKKQDEDFKARAEDIINHVSDFVESKLFDLITGATVTEERIKETEEGIVKETRTYQLQPNVRSITFYLTHKCRDRGYGEDKQLPHYDTPVIILNPQGEKPVVTIGGGLKQQEG